MTPEETRREGLAVLEQAAQLLAHYVAQVESLEAQLADARANRDRMAAQIQEIGGGLKALDDAEREGEGWQS